MGLNWNMGAGITEGDLNVQRINKWTDSIVPKKGTTQRLSGAGDQITNQLSGNILYVIVSKQDFNFASSGSALLTASVTDQYWPANEPVRHFSKTGESDYVSVVEKDGGSIDCYISVFEHTSE